LTIHWVFTRRQVSCHNLGAQSYLYLGQISTGLPNPGDHPCRVFSPVDDLRFCPRFNRHLGRFPTSVPLGQPARPSPGLFYIPLAIPAGPNHRAGVAQDFPPSGPGKPWSPNAPQPLDLRRARPAAIEPVLIRGPAPRLLEDIGRGSGWTQIPYTPPPGLYPAFHPPSFLQARLSLPISSL